MVVVVAIGMLSPHAFYAQLALGIGAAISFAVASLLIWKKSSIKTRVERPVLAQPAQKYELGSPRKKKNGIYYYKRQDLPAITELVRKAERAIVFVEVTGRGFFEILDAEGPTLTDEKKILAWLFPADSEILERQVKALEMPILTAQAAQSLEILTRFRDGMPNKKNLEIRILNSYLNHSMIIIDPGDVNSCMEIVEYSRKPIEEWAAKIIFKRDNPAEYERYFLEYQRVVEDSWNADSSIAST